MNRRTLYLKNIICTICHKIYQAKRQDKNSRCSKCRKDYMRKWRRLPKTIKRKSELHKKVREEAFNGYGYKCSCCGENRFEFLSIDHINGGGNKDRKTHSTWQIAKRVINLGFPKEYRLLCHNCNLAIGFFGKCPHQK